MRPVKKWSYSDKEVDPPIKKSYEPYNDAKADLERNLDGYCSYCEKPSVDESAHVEHVQPKGLPKYAHLEYEWSNFLISCARCNGSDNKGDKDVVFDEVHLPHLNNTLISVQYLEGGLIQPNYNLIEKELAKSKALIELVGLDKVPGHSKYKSKDKRWDRRREVWEIAKRKLEQYRSNEIDIQNIIELTRGYGFWSVWFNVFINDKDEKQALVGSFRGTDKNCFDQEYNPIGRNPTHPYDTV